MFLCVIFSSTKFGDNPFSMFGTTNGYVFHTLPLACFDTSYMRMYWKISFTWSCYENVLYFNPNLIVTPSKTY